MHWVWKSAQGRGEPPVSRAHVVSVDNKTLALPVWLSVALYLILFLLAALLFVFLLGK